MPIEFYYGHRKTGELTDGVHVRRVGAAGVRVREPEPRGGVRLRASAVLLGMDAASPAWTHPLRRTRHRAAPHVLPHGCGRPRALVGRVAVGAARGGDPEDMGHRSCHPRRRGGRRVVAVAAPRA